MSEVARVSVLATLCALLAVPAIAADPYPDRPIRLIVPFSPGGGTDINARILAGPIGNALGETIVIDNRPGAGSTLGSTLAARATPDGYTLLMGTISLTVNAAVYKELPFDAQKDFAPITRVSDQPSILVVHPSLPARTFKDLSALVRSSPGKFSFGSPGVGTGSHLASALPHVRQGRLRAYAVTTLKRADPLPDVPTLDEEGLTGFEYASWYGLFAPAGTPQSILDKIHAAAITALKSPAVLKIYEEQGLNATPTTPAEFARYIASEKKKWAGVVREAHIAQM